MNRLRLLGRAMVGVIAAGYVLLVTSTAAFASKVIEPAGGAANTTSTTVSNSGIPGWGIALIALAAVVVALFAVVTMLRVIHRPAVGRPATR